ncbi:MAG: hypothetical protein RIR90_1265 [Bacteroidota bacterium]|jgi:uncharacterized protein YndB with AHSA1/START domain
MTTLISVEVTINANVETVWEKFTKPEHIVQWNAASADWHTPSASNDLTPGGRFNYRMEARDGSMGFDLGGVYEVVITNDRLRYRLDDNRLVHVLMVPEADNTQTRLVEMFETETQNPPELQKQGWQAILNNFKQYVEGHS